MQKQLDNLPRMIALMPVLFGNMASFLGKNYTSNKAGVSWKNKLKISLVAESN